MKFETIVTIITVALFFIVVFPLFTSILDFFTQEFNIKTSSIVFIIIGMIGLISIQYFVTREAGIYYWLSIGLSTVCIIVGLIGVARAIIG